MKEIFLIKRKKNYLSLITFQYEILIGLPAAVVGITLGGSQLEGYGDETQ